MEQLFYCFGGDDGGGGGGSADDADSMDSGYDTSTVGMGTNTMGGGGDGGSDASGDPSEESTVDFSGGFDPGFDEGDTGDTGVSSAVAGSFGGRDSGAGAAGPSLIDSYLDGPMIADISTPMVGGAFVDPMTGRGVMADIPSMDYGSIGAAANVVDPGFDQDSLLGQIAPESAGGERFDYSDQDIFGDLTDEQLQQQEYVAGLQPGLPAAMITSQVQAPPTLIAEPEFIQPGGPGTRGLALTIDELAKRGVDPAQDYMEALQAANRERIASGGTRDVSTTISPMDMLDPFDDGFLSPEDKAEIAAAEAATNARIDALRGASPVEQITAQARQPVDMSPQQGRVVSETVLGGPRTAAPGTSADIDVTYSPEDAFNFAQDVLGVDQSIPQMSLAPESRPAQVDRQFRMGEVQGPMSMAPVDATRFSGIDMMRQADDVLGQRAIDEAIFGDTSDMPPSLLRVGAEVINSLESTFGGNQARKIADVANRPGGALVRDPRSGEILGAVGPEENIRSALIGAQDAVYVGDPRGYEQGVEIGSAILGPDTTVRDVPTTDPFTGEPEARPGADYSTPVIPERDGGDEGGQQILPPPVEEPIAGPAEPYQGRDIVSPYQYTPRGPISYAYTGLPSLAPQVLRPSFQVRGQYSPLFPMGNLRRS